MERLKLEGAARGHQREACLRRRQHRRFPERDRDHRPDDVSEPLPPAMTAANLPQDISVM